MHQHSTKTTPIFLPTDGEASLIRSLVSLLSASTVQPENTWFLSPPLSWGDLISKFAKILWGQKFFLHLWGDKPLWEELKLYGGSNICYYTSTISFT